MHDVFSTCGTQDDVQAEFDRLAPELRELLRGDWQTWARDDQLPPQGDWTTWLLLGGRGAGKTRAGAEWIRTQALGIAPFAERKAVRIALVGETLIDARRVMVEGVSGLLAAHYSGEKPLYEPVKRQIVWPDGVIAQIFSAEDPDSLRGPQFDVAWCDELAKWRYPERAWDMLQFGLRLGERPRQVVTTTPRPIPLLKRLLADPGTLASRARTDDNAGNLAPNFLRAVVGRYRGTRLGRQELDAEILDDRPDALWRRQAIEAARVAAAPELARIVVAVDPPASSGARADACGIVAAGRGHDGRAYVLADATVERARPLVWARAVVAAYRRHQGDRIVAEVNQGGELVEAVIRQVAPQVPVPGAGGPRQMGAGGAGGRPL